MDDRYGTGGFSQVIGMSVRLTSSEPPLISNARKGVKREEVIFFGARCRSTLAGEAILAPTFDAVGRS
jgi:hypothetical protein